MKQNEYHPATDDGGAKYARYVPAENGGNVYKFLRRVSQIVSCTWALEPTSFLPVHSRPWVHGTR